MLNEHFRLPLIPQPFQPAGATFPNCILVDEHTESNTAETESSENTSEEELLLNMTKLFVSPPPGRDILIK